MKLCQLPFYGFLSCLLAVSYANLLNYDKEIIEDAHLKTHELIRKYGYKAEVHKVYTKDGFILTMHRIVRQAAQPVLLVHGLLDSSSTWVFMGPNNSLAYLLSERGYDVWLLNVRGNRYSRKHLKLHPLMPKFWDFSFHEIGIYDLPASIDYVLRKTGYQQLHYIGHSQGCTAFYVLGSQRPAYMQKVKLMQALGPVAYLGRTQSPFITTFAPYTQLTYSLSRLLGLHELLVENEVWRQLLYKICSFAIRNTCIYSIFQIMGVDETQLNATMLPVILGHLPAGASFKAAAHYGQLFQSGRFENFNYYSAAENRRRYGSSRVPEYKLANVNCKIALYYAKNDYFTALEDVQQLRNELPNVVLDQRVDYDKFNHIDFLWAIDAKSLLYEQMFELMEKVDKGEI